MVLGSFVRSIKSAGVIAAKFAAGIPGMSTRSRESKEEGNAGPVVIPYLGISDSYAAKPWLCVSSRRSMGDVAHNASLQRLVRRRPTSGFIRLPCVRHGDILIGSLGADLLMEIKSTRRFIVARVGVNDFADPRRELIDRV